MNDGRGRLRVEWSVRAYRVLCLAYPRRFRDAFGRDMALDFARFCRDAVDSRRRFALTALWIGSIVDVAVNAGALRMAKYTERGGGQIGAAAYSLMLIAVPLLLLAKIVGQPVPANLQVQRLTALAVHCALMILVAASLGRRVPATLGIAVVVATAVFVDLARLGLKLTATVSVSVALFDALRISVPVLVVLMLVTFAPVRRAEHASGA